MIMFCGLPVIVAVEPMLAAVARPIRCGIGSSLSRRVRCNKSGVSATQTTSLTRNADSTPDSTMVTAKQRRRPAQPRQRQPASTRKKPASRRNATTIIIANNSTSVL